MCRAMSALLWILPYKQAVLQALSVSHSCFSSPGRVLITAWASGFWVRKALILLATQQSFWEISRPVGLDQVSGGRGGPRMCCPPPRLLLLPVQRALGLSVLPRHQRPSSAGWLGARHWAALDLAPSSGMRKVQKVLMLVCFSVVLTDPANYCSC